MTLTFTFTSALSAQAQPGQKLTFCSITINSEDEKLVFQSKLSKEDFKFVELVSGGAGHDWFEKACASGVKCDVLLIFGHFAEMFFGKSNRTLSLKTQIYRTHLSFKA